MRVLFVCTGNTCRSPFAAAVARREANVDVESAGLAALPGAESPDDAVAVAKEFRIDLSSHRARPLTADLLARADLVVGMTADHLTALDRQGATGKTRLLGRADIDDPIGCGRGAYRRVYAQIESDVRTLFEAQQ